ncbi:MAG: FliH/SctL family protein [Candidatus Eiseniibacteriota bacterium]
MATRPPDGPMHYVPLLARSDGVRGIEAAEADALDAALARSHAAGFAESEARIAEQTEQALKALEGVVERLEMAWTNLEHDWKPNLYSLSLAVARKLVQRELTANPEIVTDLIDRALQLVPLDRTLEIRLNPSDLAALGDRLERAVPADRAVTVRWVPDVSLDRGAFVVETPQRIVDGRSDVALRRLYDRLDDE